jgi:hypothetical protein
MPGKVDIWVHLQLYRYWLSKRNGGRMPAQAHIDPVDIPMLLPYISIAHKVDGQFRYRLVGSELARQVGRNLTGDLVGHGISSDPKVIAAVQAIGESTHASGQPHFATWQMLTRLGALLNGSTLVLPLSNDGAHVNRIIFSRVVSFTSRTAKVKLDWLAGVPFHLVDVVAIANEAGLRRLGRDWEHDCIEHEPHGLAARGAH